VGLGLGLVVVLVLEVLLLVLVLEVVRPWRRRPKHVRSVSVLVTRI
jgi:hypothetical protein